MCHSFYDLKIITFQTLSGLIIIDRNHGEVLKSMLVNLYSPDRKLRVTHLLKS